MPIRLVTGIFASLWLAGCGAPATRVESQAHVSQASVSAAADGNNAPVENAVQDPAATEEVIEMSEPLD
jgi:hypothetical protein